LNKYGRSHIVNLETHLHGVIGDAKRSNDWVGLVRTNSFIKEQFEDSWAREDLPTFLINEGKRGIVVIGNPAFEVKTNRN